MFSNRRVRILLAKLGQGKDRTQLELAKALSKAGFEVIYTDLQDPVAIAESAVQEAVDHIGITVLSAVTAGTFGRLLEILKNADAAEVTVSAGGTIDPSEAEGMVAAGVTTIFRRGTTIDELVAWASANIRAIEG